LDACSTCPLRRWRRTCAHSTLKKWLAEGVSITLAKFYISLHKKGNPSYTINVLNWRKLDTSEDSGA
jgi:hypothetical protein